MITKASLSHDFPRSHRPIPRSLQATGISPSASVRAPLTLNPEAAENLLEPSVEDDWTFVPNPPTSAHSAAADLRSALE